MIDINVPKIEGLEEAIKEGVKKYVSNRFKKSLIEKVDYYDIYELISFPEEYNNKVDLTYIYYVLQKMIILLNEHKEIYVIKASTLNRIDKYDAKEKDPDMIMKQDLFIDLYLNNKLALIKW